tara:strand:- start:662 stop:826 length:165 start_codon:yes stop_codon:yes gene_type:complete
MNIEKRNQLIFEKQLELLITYKKSHLNEDVYLNEEFLNKALNWLNNLKNKLSTI